MKLRSCSTSLPSPSLHQGKPRRPRAAAIISMLLAVVVGAALPAAHAAPQSDKEPARVHATGEHWQDLSSAVVDNLKAQNSASVAAGANARTPAAPAGLRARKFRATMLDRPRMRALAATAPRERTQAGRDRPLVISLPYPDGGYQRFAIVDSPVMEPELAARHPEIRTFSGKGIDDPSATVRMDITPLGLHASVRSPKGAWYVDPYNHLDDSVYASYHGRDLESPHGVFREGEMAGPQLVVAKNFYHAADTVEVSGTGFTPGAAVTIEVRNAETDGAATQSFIVTADQDGVVTFTVTADPNRNTGSYQIVAKDGATESAATFLVVPDDAGTNAVSGNDLRTYRLALLTDPSYATYFGGSANVTAAKVTLINRVTQVYEAETSIRLVLINGNDALNLDTAAQMTGANGPCGGTACYTATQAASCGSSTLTRTRQVIGLLAGASNFDVGHIALGVNGGGIASLGVVGGPSKAQGCTGIPTPVGDFFAVDYVAHEMGHQFAGNHTFNGVISNCASTNRNAGTSVEPGSGSSIMAYAGICGTDNLQTHSDAYWSQRSFDEIVAYTSAAETSANEVQMGVLTGFTANGLSFKLQYNGGKSAAITRGTTFTAAGIKAAIEAIPGWPAGGTVTASSVGDTAFTLTFGGTLAGTNVAGLQLVECSGACSGYVGEITAGGLTTRRGATSPSGNSSPIVTVTPTYTIPVRTPFVLAGSAVDPDGDELTYMWEQNDRAAATGTGLISNTKVNGPLFRQFGKRAVVSAADTIQYGSAGENLVTTTPTRVFPDLSQILVNNTNAATGACPTASATPTGTEIDCFSEYLPTASYVGFAGTNAAPASLHFKLTARDGRGGINSATTTLVLAPAAGPFLVTSPNTAVSLNAGSVQTVTWSVANTNVAPVSEANVKISLSTDGGLTYPFVLAASTPNTGSKSVTMPMVASTTARVKVESLTNVFFDVSDSNFTLVLVGDANGDGAVTCDDLVVVKASMGKRTGQAGFDARADINRDGVVDVRDVALVSKAIPAGTSCN